MKRSPVTMKHLIFAAAISLGMAVHGQTLSKPPLIQHAFDASTRQEDGMPGKAYWQNRANYNISVFVAPPVKTVRGVEDITYFNNSPDALSTLVLKLFLNIHKADAPRMGPAEKDYLTNGITIDAVTINGKPFAWTPDAKTFTIASLPLSKPLAAHDSIKLSFKWHFDVSVQSGREGALDATSFYLAYFYPRIAVYDDYHGWDDIPFNDALEFYSDFNDYTLNVQVPKNFIVWATGTLTNPAQVLSPELLVKYNQSQTTDDVVKMLTPQNIAAKNFTANNTTNTWKFTAANVPDVALGLSDHYTWDAGSVLVDAASGRRAVVNAAYIDSSKDYHYMVNFGKAALAWLSSTWPGVPYPYPKSSVYQGQADMEYPMMVNDNTFGDTTFARFVVMHEMAHTYMPFYMGINETTYGFMDEGWATTFEYLFNVDKMGKDKADEFFKRFRVQGWIRNLSRGMKDQPIVTPGTELFPQSLGDNEYGKPALGYLAMKDYLGDDVFRKCLQTYMMRWHGKHPTPWDFFNTFSNASGENLNWFWNAWFFQPNAIDLALKDVKTDGNTSSLTVQNVGGMPAPFDVVATYADGSTQRFHQTPGVWKNDLKSATISVTTTQAPTNIKLDGGIFMDAHPADNVLKKAGM